MNTIENIDQSPSTNITVNELRRVPEPPGWKKENEGFNFIYQNDETRIQRTLTRYVIEEGGRRWKQRTLIYWIGVLE